MLLTGFKTLVLINDRSCARQFLSLFFLRGMYYLYFYNKYPVKNFFFFSFLFFTEAITVHTTNTHGYNNLSINIIVVVRGWSPTFSCNEHFDLYTVYSY